MECVWQPDGQIKWTDGAQGRQKRSYPVWKRNGNFGEMRSKSTFIPSLQ